MSFINGLAGDYRECKTMDKTTVVNVHHKVPYDVYIGRAGKGESGEFGNPHTGPNREANVKLFKKYFHERLKSDKTFARRVLKLRGKVLACFCSPKPCHGDVIAEYLNSLPEPNPIKLAVVGSRDFVDYKYLCEMLDWFEIKQIISGGDKGANRLAKRYAEENTLDYKEFPAEWDRYGKSAGYRRNVQIVESADEVVAFWNKTSRGTGHSIQIAKELGKPMHLFTFDNSVSIIDDELSRLG